jgi:hypothetical protein
VALLNPQSIFATDQTLLEQQAQPVVFVPSALALPKDYQARAFFHGIVRA